MDLTLFAGSANRPLAEAIAARAGVRLGACDVHRYPDGEVSVSLQEPVRRNEVYIIQPTSPPVDEHLVELLAFGDACRRASADRIIAVMPYFGYGRSDKRLDRREPIGASMVASLLEAVGFTHAVALDIHAPQIEGFFRIPFDNLSSTAMLAEALHPHLPEEISVVSPDAGRVRTATALANRLGVPLVVMHKRRESGSETEVTHIVGDVRGRACLLIDDIISTGGTIAESMEALRHAGADGEIFVAATHGLFLADAREQLASATRVIVTDSVMISPERWKNLTILSIAPLFAEAIRRISADGSLGWLK